MTHKAVQDQALGLDDGITVPSLLLPAAWPACSAAVGA